MCRAGFHSEDNFTDEPNININRGLCLSFRRFVLLLSGSAVLQCLCALVCSGRGLLWLWMALCLSQLSPRLPRFSAIHPSTSETALFLCNHMVGNLATVCSHWREPKLLHSHILQSCLLPDRSHVRRITFVMSWHNGAVRESLILSAVPCDVFDTPNPVMMYL